MVALLALPLAGCVYTPETTVAVRDPAGVQVYITDEHGKSTPVLPPGAAASQSPLPQTTPPFEEGLRPVTTFKRHAGGPVDIQCDDCSPSNRVLLATDGTMLFSTELNLAKLDFTREEMRVRFRDRRALSVGSTSTYLASAATPWTNVTSVRRVSTPSRSTGLRLLLSGGVAATLGGFALEDGVSLHHSTTTIFGAILLPLAVVLATGGTWYLVAPPRESVLYGPR